MHDLRLKRVDLRLTCLYRLHVRFLLFQRSAVDL